MITVGMNYKVRAGKEELFEGKFAAVLDTMKGMPGHVDTHLYRDVAEATSYLIVSEWSSKQEFGAFIRSPEFRSVTDWGKEEILAGRPMHRVYNEEPMGPPGAPGSH